MSRGVLHWCRCEDFTFSKNLNGGWLANKEIHVKRCHLSMS